MIKYYHGKRYEGTVESIALEIFLDKRKAKKARNKPILDKLDELINLLMKQNNDLERI
jgi:hypothetical protein